MGEEDLPFLGQLYTAGVAGKQGSVKAVLQLADGLTDGRLADIELTGSFGNVAGPGNRVKDSVLRKILIHFPPCFRVFKSLYNILQGFKKFLTPVS